MHKSELLSSPTYLSRIPIEMQIFRVEKSPIIITFKKENHN